MGRHPVGYHPNPVELGVPHPVEPHNESASEEVRGSPAIWRSKTIESLTAIRVGVANTPTSGRMAPCFKASTESSGIPNSIANLLAFSAPPGIIQKAAGRFSSLVHRFANFRHQ